MTRRFALTPHGRMLAARTCLLIVGIVLVYTLVPKTADAAVRGPVAGAVAPR